MKLFRAIERVLSFLKSLFLNGLFTLIPITATLFVLHFMYNLVVRWLTPLRKVQPGFLESVPGSEIIIVILLIMFFGAILKFLVLQPLINYLESVIEKIPLIRTIYSSSKTVVDFFNVPDPAREQKKVVLVEYPRKGVYTLGFMLEMSRGNYQRVIQEDTSATHDLVKVFIPSSPAPTTGYFMILPRTDVIETDITFEEAIKAIVSCGLITPDSLNGDNDTFQANR